MRNGGITRYEIAARHPDGRAYLVGYSPRLSRHGLLAAMQKVGQQIIDRLAIGETDQITFATKPRIHAKTGDWCVGFTGRTQLECQQSGQLPYIAS